MIELVIFSFSLGLCYLLCLSVIYVVTGVHIIICYIIFFLMLISFSQKLSVAVYNLFYIVFIIISCMIICFGFWLGAGWVIFYWVTKWFSFIVGAYFSDSIWFFFL